MWIHSFKNHKKIKKTILGLIKEIPITRVNDFEDSITHSDYHLPKDYKRKYLDYFYSHLDEHMLMLCELFNSQNWSIKSSWFQQYYKGDVHGWHNHGESQLAGVYYLELPNKSMTTEFLDGSKIEAKEGDILIFPSYKYHRSKKNILNKRKTVIAFNCSFDVWNGNLPFKKKD